VGNRECTAVLFRRLSRDGETNCQAARNRPP
jgi:hypothetical protein